MNADIKILPKDRVQAFNTLIKATKALVDLAEREAQALMQNDMMTFAILQEEKDFLSKRYQKLADEFHDRLEEFRGLDTVMLDRLENMQKMLAEKTRANSAALFTIYSNSQQKTQESLLSVQELAQSKPVTIDGTDKKKVNGSSEGA